MANAGQKETLIVGLGATGISCARFLASRGESFRVADSRSNPPALTELVQDYPEVAVELGKFKEQSFVSASALVVSPGVSLREPAIMAARDQGISISGDIDLFSRHVQAPIVAVTGSNGKSTVVEILASILHFTGCNFGVGGNLDGHRFKPALDLLLEAEQRQLYLLELSSFQLETTEKLNAEVACILNISADHQDRYNSMEDYILAKQRIYKGAKHIVVNRDDVLTFPSRMFTAIRWDFGFGQPGSSGFGLLEEDGEQYLAFQFEKIMRVNELKVFGRHNVANVLAAAAMAVAAGIRRKSIIEAIRGFTGLPHRCQWIANVTGIEFYNDSKGTNVGATMAAVEGLGQRISGHIVLIAGGVGKGADFQTLVPVIKRWVKQVILMGRDAAAMAADFDAEVQTSFARNMQEAVRTAFNHAESGDAVLLSPACASYDMFENYQQRGQSFVQSVENLQ
ncbi:MAG: UDP-N-acetylmuramoyl-L-alanine--D-glutamate ligase [Gammaproteobacteria bacterium]|nr:UDP-N-acetylmuramoyl-L-alanine--D-glutamate ligase [Gammaproteobacteria bacterium]